MRWAKCAISEGECCVQELQERKKIRKKERKKKKRPDNEGEPQTAAVAASENEQAEGGESSDEATNRQNSPEPQQQPQLTADATTPGQKDRDGTAVLQSTPDEAASLHQKEPRAAAMLQSSTGKAAAIDVKADSVMGSGQTVQRKSPGEGRVSSARVVEGGAGQDEEAAAPDAATRAEGVLS